MPEFVRTSAGSGGQTIGRPAFVEAYSFQTVCYDNARLAPHATFTEPSVGFVNGRFTVVPAENVSSLTEVVYSDQDRSRSWTL